MGLALALAVRGKQHQSVVEVKPPRLRLSELYLHFVIVSIAIVAPLPLHVSTCVLY